MLLTADMVADLMAIDPDNRRILANSASRYRSVRLLLPGRTRLDNAEAWVAESWQLSTLEYVDPGCLIICPGEVGMKLDCSLLIDAGGLADTYAAAVRAFEACEAFDNELKDRLLAGSGLDGLLDVCARFFRNTVQVIDPAFNVVAGTAPVVDPVSGAVTGFAQDVSSFSASTLDEMAKSNLLHETYAYRSARFHKSTLFKYQSVIVNLYQENQYLGKLLIIESIAHLGPGTVDAADQLAPYFSHLLQKRSSELNVTLHTAEHFISEFLKGNINDANFIAVQLASLTWRLQDHYAIATIQIKSKVLTEFYSQIIRNHFSDALVFPSGDCLVVILRLKSADLSDLKPNLEQLLDEARLLGGISEVFRDFRLARDHFIQARAALHAAIHLQAPGTLHRYQDHALNHLIQLASQTGEQRAFLHPAIPILVGYDRDNHTDFLKTLKTYLSSSFNQVLTANRLHIHRKTLQYRLTRLAKIAAVDLDNPDEQIRLMLSVLFHEAETSARELTAE